MQQGGRYSGKEYQKTQSEYSASYGKPLVTIKRWWAKCHPLDDPDAMGEYLSPRGRKAESQAEFEAPSRVSRPEFAEEPVPRFDTPTDEALEAAPVQLDDSFLMGQGVLAAIERLQKAERERAAAYFQAIRRNQPPQVLKNRFGEWIGIVEALRKLEKDAPEIRKLNNLSVSVAEVEAALGQILQAFRTGANNLPGRAAAKLEGLTDHGEILDVLEREVEVLLRTLADVALNAVAVAEAAAARAEEGDAPCIEPRDEEPAPPVDPEPPAPKPKRKPRPKKRRKSK